MNPAFSPNQASMPSMPANGQGANPLDQLRDIHLPDQISWMPTALGWWILAAVAIISITTLIVLGLRWYRSQAYRREAIRILGDIKSASLSVVECSRQCQQLLKRTSLHVAPRISIAQLSGDKWIAFLNDHCKQNVFDQTLSNQWQNALYQPEHASSEFESTQFQSRLISACETWLKQHRKKKVNSKNDIATTQGAQHA